MTIIGKIFGIFLFGIMLTACGTQEQNISWIVPYNTGTEESQSFVANDGYWERPLGLYSFLATEDVLVLEDSVRHRIVVYDKSFEPAYISMPEQMVCAEMGYDLEDNVLYLLLVDNNAVEPNVYRYCKVILDESLELQEIRDVEISNISETIRRTDLDSKGNIIARPDYLKEADILSTVQQLDISEEFDSLNVFFCTQSGDTELYACYDGTKGESMFLVLAREGEIIAQSQVLKVGEVLRPSHTCAYMYEGNSGIKVVYMYIEGNELKVSEVEMKNTGQNP